MKSTAILSLLLLTAGLFSQPAAAAQDDIWLTLVCSGSAPNSQYPERNDSKKITLQVDTSGAMGGSGYRLTRVYNGGYPTNDETYGTIHSVQRSGNVVSFTLDRVGMFHKDTVPLFANWGKEEIKAAFNLETNELQLDLSNLPWFYKNVSLLNCKRK